MDTFILKFNKEDDWFECDYEIDKNIIHFLVNGFEEKDMETANELAKKIIVWYNSNKENILEYAVTEELIQLKNEDWLEEGEKEISKQEFKSRIVLESILVYKKGDFELWYGDGDIFWGHGIKVDISKDFGFIKADMV